MLTYWFWFVIGVVLISLRLLLVWLGLLIVLLCVFLFVGWCCSFGLVTFVLWYDVGFAGYCWFVSYGCIGCCGWVVVVCGLWCCFGGCDAWCLVVLFAWGALWVV